MGLMSTCGPGAEGGASLVIISTMCRINGLLQCHRTSARTRERMYGISRKPCADKAFKTKKVSESKKPTWYVTVSEKQKTKTKQKPEVTLFVYTRFPGIL